MSRLAGISGRRTAIAFERAGFQVGKSLHGHVALKKLGFPVLVIPLQRELSPILLRSQMQRAGLTEKKFLELLPRLALGNLVVIG